MIRDSISIQDLVDYLNKIAQDDPKALRTLLLTAVKCGTRKLAEADYIAVSRTSEGTSCIGLAAILGSLFGVNDKGGGAIIFDATKKKVRFRQESMSTDPDAYAKKRGYERMGGVDTPDYTIDERRVVKYLDEIAPGIGAGHDPIGFLIAAHAALSTSAMHAPLIDLKGFNFPPMPGPEQPIGLPTTISTAIRS